jgi:hypothetical protein
MGDHEQAGVGPQAPADPYDIGAGAEIGQAPDSDNDGLTDAFEKLAATSGALANTDAGPSNAHEAVSSNTDPLSDDGDFDGLTEGPEMSYQSDPLSDIHGGPWNRGFPGGVDGPQPDQGGHAGAESHQGGLGAPRLNPGGLGAPQPDQDSLDPAGSGHLDDTGPLDLN